MKKKGEIHDLMKYFKPIRRTFPLLWTTVGKYRKNWHRLTWYTGSNDSKRSYLIIFITYFQKFFQHEIWRNWWIGFDNNGFRLNTGLNIRDTLKFKGKKDKESVKKPHWMIVFQTCIQTRARTDLQFCRGCAWQRQHSLRWKHKKRKVSADPEDFSRGNVNRTASLTKSFQRWI